MTSRQAALKIIRRLRRNGFNALMAGGCVRDMLLGRRARDYDVATSATPQQVRKLFRRTLHVGAKFGVVVVIMEGRSVEVATFRSESGYKDGRHPGNVRFSTPAEDASRRDFTINGMFYDPVGREVIDYVGGRADLERRIVRTIGSPGKRFGEDHLRMLRAVRFATQLDFTVERRTFSAIRSRTKDIRNISGERISAEIEDILIHPDRASGVGLLADCGLLQTIFPLLKTRGAAPAAGGVLSRLPGKVDYMLSLAGLFAACRTDLAVKQCSILKLSRKHARHLEFLLAGRGILLDEDMPLGRLKLFLAKPYFRDLYRLQVAIEKAMENRANLSVLRRLGRRISAIGQTDINPPPLLNGHDLIALGAVPGPALGQLAEELYITQLEGRIIDSSQAQLWACRWLTGHRN